MVFYLLAASSSPALALGPAAAACAPSARSCPVMLSRQDLLKGATATLALGALSAPAAFAEDDIYKTPKFVRKECETSKDSFFMIKCAKNMDEKKRAVATGYGKKAKTTGASAYRPRQDYEPQYWQRSGARRVDTAAYLAKEAELSAAKKSPFGLN